MGRGKLADEYLREFEAAVEAFEQRIMVLSDKAADLPREEVAEVVVGVKRLAERLGMCWSSLGTEVARRMRSGSSEDLIIVDGATLEKKVGTPRKTWQHKAIRSVIIEKVLASHVDRETGALDCPSSVLMADVLNACSISGYKSTVCKPLGINVNLYCTTEQAKTSLIIRAAS